MSIHLADRLRFDRQSIPDRIRDMDSWPTFDIGSLSEDRLATFQKRREAIRLFVDPDSVSLSEIKRRTGISARQVYYLFERCTETNSDGRINGFRALNPYKHRNEYSRSQKVTAHSAKPAGAFSQLLQRYPNIKDWLIRLIKGRISRSSSKEIRIIATTNRQTHKNFLKRCRQDGVKDTDYPFNQALLGIRSLSTHLKLLANELLTFSEAAANLGCTNAGKPPSETPYPTIGTALRPYDVIEFDGHKVDLRLRLTVMDPYGFETDLEIERCWILVFLDVFTRCVLGYSVVIGGENYTKDDVLRAVRDSLEPHLPRQLKIPGLAYASGGGFPSSRYPECRYRCWTWLKFDNAKAHLAEETLRRINSVVGSIANAGPAGEPDSRPFVERLFRTIAENFSHRVTGSTGSSVDDIVAKLADPGSNASLLMSLEEFEELIDVVIANYNGEPHSGIGGRTPIEAMSLAIQRGYGLPRHTPQFLQSDLYLLNESRVVTVRGNVAKGVRPYIQYESARYRNSVLSESVWLLGKNLRIYVDTDDLRRVRAFQEDGTELGLLLAERPWHAVKHSLAVRRKVLQLTRQRKLVYGDDVNPVEAYVDAARKEALRSKRRRAATALAIAEKSSGVSSVTPPPTEPKSTTPKQPEFTASPVSPQVEDTNIATTGRIKAPLKRRTVLY